MAAVREVLRVAQIVGKMMGGGVEAMVMNYFRGMDPGRVSFDFIVDRDSEMVPREEILARGGRVFEIAPYQRPLAYQRELAALLRQNRYPIAHAHINTLSVFALRAAKRAGVPVRIAHSHSTAGRGEHAKNLMKYTLRPLAGIYPTHRFACSAHAGRWLFGRRDMESGGVTLVRNAIDLDRFDYHPAQRDAARAALGVGDRLVFGHVGRFMTQKNHGFLLDILRELVSRRPDCLLLLVGEGERMGEIRARVDNEGLGGHVRFLGARDDVPALMQAMDLLLLPSLYEGLPLVVVEAQACGLGVVASSEVSREAQVTDRITFLPLSEPPAVWAERALAQAGAARASQRAQLGAAGYDIAIAAGELERCYLALAQGEAAPGTA